MPERTPEAVTLYTLHEDLQAGFDDLKHEVLVQSFQRVLSLSHGFDPA